jgi:hypothetical protein
MKRLLIAAAVTASVARAHASVCVGRPSNRNWYAVIDKRFTTRADHGAAINVETTTLTSGSPGSTFVNHEMWYGVTSSCAYWVEVGVDDGATYGSALMHHAIFWADNRASGGGYHEHFPAVGWSLGAYYQLKVVWAGGYSWNVYFGGVYLGTSTNNAYGGNYRCLMAGIEASGASARDHVGGHMYGWARKDVNNRWYQDWDGKSLWSYCPADIDVDSNNITTEVLHGPN